MEDFSIAIAKVEAMFDATRTPAARAEKQRRVNRCSLLAYLTRVKQVIDVQHKACACCGGELHAIGEDVAERLDVVPSSFRLMATAVCATPAVPARAKRCRRRHHRGS